MSNDVLSVWPTLVRQWPLELQAANDLQKESGVTIFLADFEKYFGSWQERLRTYRIYKSWAVE